MSLIPALGMLHRETLSQKTKHKKEIKKGREEGRKEESHKQQNDHQIKQTENKEEPENSGSN